MDFSRVPVSRWWNNANKSLYVAEEEHNAPYSAMKHYIQEVFIKIQTMEEN